MSSLDLARINEKIADRSNVFYWQTDRAIEPSDAGEIWLDRHSAFTDEEIIQQANIALNGAETVVSLEPFADDAQTNLGSINSVRVGTLASGTEVVLRNHPRGVQNGYFHAEAAVSALAKAAGLAAYKTFAIHDFNDGNDFAQMIIEKLPGFAVQKWLEAHPADEPTMVAAMGRTMARMSTLAVQGYGPFDNERARAGELVGLHDSQSAALRAGLSFNLQVLQDQGFITAVEAGVIDQLFNEENPLLQTEKSYVVHNDFADWNALTDGNEITGILDWDECVAGDPVMDVACWSTFFDPARMEGFLNAYFETLGGKPPYFDEKFELFRMRYVVSKMTLRLRRYTWQPTDSIKTKIEAGTAHLRDSLKYFDIRP